MILIDTSVWGDHLRAGDEGLAELLDAGLVLTHPFVVGEIALGSLRQREIVMDALSGLPSATVATDAEVLQFIDRYAVFGRGIGYVDVHLLAGAQLTGGAQLWTNDNRLRKVAHELSLAFRPRSSLAHSVADATIEGQTHE